MNQLQPSKRDWVIEQTLLKDRITTWARNWGLDDDAQLSAEEAYEMLEDGVLHFITHIREEAVDKIREDFIEWKSCGAMDERKEAEIEWDVDFMGWVKTREKLDTLKPKESL